MKTLENEKSTVKTAKQTTKAVNKPKAVKKVSTYETNVLTPNRALKIERKTLGGARAILLTFAPAIKLKSSFESLLKQSKKQENYIILQSFVKPHKTKTGVESYSAFRLLQVLNKHESELKQKFV